MSLLARCAPQSGSHGDSLAPAFSIMNPAATATSGFKHSETVVHKPTPRSNAMERLDSESTLALSASLLLRHHCVMLRSSIPRIARSRS